MKCTLNSCFSSLMGARVGLNSIWRFTAIPTQKQNAQANKAPLNSMPFSDVLIVMACAREKRSAMLVGDCRLERNERCASKRRHP